MHRIRGTFRYANVVSTLCLVLLLGGGTAYAATQLVPKQSVGAAQIKKGAVTPGKLSSAAKDAMTGATGPEGPKGDTGAKGDTGPQGAPGIKGDPGVQGDPGVKGDQGVQGDPGVKGDPGVQGDPGVKGDQGETGPSDVYSARLTLKAITPGFGYQPVVSVALPAGNYLVSATQTAESEGGQSTVECAIFSGSTSVETFYARVPTGLSGTVAGQATIALSAETTVSEQCGSTEHVMDLSGPVLSAIKVGTLH
jgi:Collagen triple helix repeat (20 copies)